MPSRARCVRIRSTHARSSSSVRAFGSESIGSRCVTFSSLPTGSPPTRWVGESGVRNSRMLGLDRAQLVQQRVVDVVADLRIVEHVVAVGVVFELRAQLLGARLRRSGRRSRRRRAPGRSATGPRPAGGADPAAACRRRSRRDRRPTRAAPPGRSHAAPAGRRGRSGRSGSGSRRSRPAATAARSVPGSSWNPGSEP